MTEEKLIEAIRIVPDFPVKGIQFFDVTTLFKDAACYAEVIDRICSLYADKGITKVAGIESRGFVTGAAVAARLGAGFVPIRKPGKLPARVVSEKYTKEYGTDSLEIHDDAITPDDVVLVHDDILATGGTASAAIRLVKGFSPRAVYCNFIIDITDCPVTSPFPDDVSVESILYMSER